MKDKLMSDEHITKEPTERIALNLSASLKASVEEWRRAQPAIPTWTAAARHLLVIALDVEAAKAARTAARMTNNASAGADNPCITH